MAVLQMQRISLCALKKNRKPILETLQKHGVVEVQNLVDEEGVFENADTLSERSQFDKNVALAGQALEILDAYAPVKSSMLSMFEGRRTLTQEEYEDGVARRDEMLHTATVLTQLSKKIAENRAEIVRRQTQLDALEPWMDLDVSLRFTGTRTTAAFIGSFQEEWTVEQIYTELAARAPEVDAVSVDLVSQSRDQICVFILTRKENAEKVEEALRSMGFIRPASPPKAPPRERKEILLGYIEKAGQAIQSAEKEIIGLADKRESLKFMADYYAMRAEKYAIIGSLAQSRRTFFLSGYLPKRYAAALEAELTRKFDLALEISDCAPDDENVPVALKNNAFTEPVEGVLSSYSLPGKGEVDPTPIMAVFYYFLFGLMFSDAAYGLILTLATGFILLRFKNMEQNWKKNMRMFFFCGISTTIWGVIFGSYFGNVFDQVALTFFHVPASATPIVPAAWFAPLDNPMKMLVFCMGVGVIHLFTGLAINAYQCIRQRKFFDLFSKVIFWYLLVGGGIVFLLSTEMIAKILQLGATLPSAVGTVGGWLAILGAIGIVLTNGSSKNPIVRFFQGLYELYNVTGYLSDILSYSRLLALGLATGVIGTVVNQMGSMGGSGFLGLIMFLLVFVLGQTLNFGIEILGAYVHTNRLQYVEFFGKFYEGGGRPFEPFAAHTKYFKFKEDN